MSIDGKTIVALIPARGGSKRIPGKNIVNIHGKPLLAYTVELALRIPEIDSVVVSSDDEDILAVARASGAEALRRPAEYALDETQDEPVLLHALDALEAQGKRYDYIVMLQCTQPLRTLETVRSVMEKGIRGGFDTVSTCVKDLSRYRRFRSGTWIEVDPGASRRSQEREPYFREADVCYMLKVSALRATGSIFGGTYDFVPVDEIENTDINEPRDLELVRCLMQVPHA